MNGPKRMPGGMPPAAFVGIHKHDPDAFWMSEQAGGLPSYIYEDMATIYLASVPYLTTHVMVGGLHVQGFWSESVSLVMREGRWRLTMDNVAYRSPTGSTPFVTNEITGMIGYTSDFLLSRIMDELEKNVTW